MLSLNSPARCWPLVFRAAALAASTVLAACADDPVGPKSPPAASPSVQPAADPIYLTVTNASGGTEVGSIRWAASQIRFSTAYIRFDPKLAGATITLGAELYLDNFTTIEAPPGGITLSGNDQHRVILAPAGVELQNVTVTKGNHADGSAIYSGARLILKHTTVHDNRGSGPVIESEGWYVFLLNTTISRNTGTGALEYEDGSQVTIVQSTIAFNAGAGLRYDNGPDLSTIISLNNSIVANNSVNCTSTYKLTYGGANISSDWSCGEVNIVVTDPQLMPLAYNGGPNMTHAIPHTSPAFNSAPYCMVDDDQRYVRRGPKCDLGAFEFNDFTQVAITIDQGVKVSSATGKAMLTGTVKCTRADTFGLYLELHQDQKINGEIVDVHSVSSLPVQCSTTAKAWSVPMELLPGEAFQAGAAKAIVQTSNPDTPEWVTPASVSSGVRISVGRK
jgi:hypothetical protein